MNERTSRMQITARLTAALAPLAICMMACSPASSGGGDTGGSAGAGTTGAGGTTTATGGTGGAGAGTSGAGGTTTATGGTGGAGGTSGSAGAGGTSGSAGAVSDGGGGRGGAPDGSGDAAGTGGRANTGGSEGGVAEAGGSDMMGSCPSGGWTAGDKKLTLTFGGLARTYEVHIPASYTGTAPVPLVMTIHGAHNTIALARSWSQMNPVSDQNGFIVVYPQGVDCWNAGFAINGCAAAPDDVGFLKAVVADVESHTCIDRKRVYATGISNGSMMSQYLGCQASDVFAAVAGVSGGAQCQSTPRAVSLFYVHGTEDKTISFSSAQPDVDGWVKRNGCGTTPMETYNMGSTKCVTYGGCREGAEVVFCTVTGMGHCWPEDSKCGPGGGAMYAVTDFKASPMMWEFFKKHPMP